MSLSPRLIAIQGIGFTPIALAIQGLVDYLASGGSTGWDTSQGKAGTNPPGKDYTAENLRRLWEAQQKQDVKRVPETYNLTRLHDDDLEATDFILAWVTKGFLNGYRQSHQLF